MEQSKFTPIHSSIILAGIIFLISLSIIRFFGLSLPVSIENRTVSAELSVVGEGKVDIVPDIATIQAGITAEGQSVKAVEEKINEINNKIILAVGDLDIDKKDIKTSNYSINPSYEPIPVQFPKEPSISGYSGNASLTIIVRKQEFVSKVIAATTEAGGNQVYNSGFTVDNPSKYREEARSKAIQNAKEQAQKLANELGISLGKVVNISESNSNPPEIYPVMKSVRDIGGGVAPDIEPGTQSVTSVVTLYFEKR